MKTIIDVDDLIKQLNMNTIKSVNGMADSYDDDYDDYDDCSFGCCGPWSH